MLSTCLVIVDRFGDLLIAQVCMRANLLQQRYFLSFSFPFNFQENRVAISSVWGSYNFFIPRLLQVRLAFLNGNSIHIHMVHKNRGELDPIKFILDSGRNTNCTKKCNSI